MNEKRKEKVKVSFVGSNASEVTGSCTLIENGDTKYLIECGLYQSVKSVWDNYKVNTKKFKFKAKDISAIFACHDHIDHIGLLPMLYAHKCTAPIFIPEGNKEIFRILLEDCAFINIRDAELISTQRGRDYPPIYTLDNVDECMKYVKELPLNEPIEIDEKTTAEFIGSGHILGACQLILKTKVGNITKTIGYSSDLGNISINNRYTTKFTPIKKADLFIGECTYAESVKGCKQKDRDKDMEKLKTIITDTCIEKHSRVLIPCFASSRTQTMISCLYDIFGEDPNFTIPILIDSPMACKITRLYESLLDGEEKEYYKRVLSWRNLRLIETIEDSKAWRESYEPCVVCSASGMLTAGRSLGWLGKLLPNGNNHIIFVGYIPTDGGIGIKIKNGTCKTITLSGKRVANKCKITSLTSFSSHMQYPDLLKYYSKVNAPKIALVHGNQNAKINFARILQEKISENTLSGRVIAAQKDTSFNI